MIKKLSLALLVALVSSSTAGYKAGGEARRLPGDGETVRMRPLWSPDGVRIAYTGANYAGLWVVQTDGSNLRQVSAEAGAGFGFAWSADGTALLARVAKFEGRKRLNGIKLFDLHAGSERLLGKYDTRFMGLPHWADADRKVCAWNGNKLAVFATGRPARRLAQSQPEPGVLFAERSYCGRQSADRCFQPVGKNPGSADYQSAGLPGWRHTGF